MNTHIKTTARLLVALSLALLAGATQPAAANPAPETPAANATAEPAIKAKTGDRAAPLVGLTYLKGAPVTFEKGRVYLVEFWATWCGPCVANMPHLTKLQKKYRDQGLTVIAVSIDEDADKAKAFVAERGDTLGFTVAHDADGQAHENYMTAFGRRYIPCAFLVDQQGRVVWVGQPWHEMDAVLAKVVDKTFDLPAYTKAQAEKKARQQQAAEITKAYYKALHESAAIADARPVAARLYKLGHPDVLADFAQDILYQEEEGEDADNSRVDFELALEFATRAHADTAGQDIRTLDIYTSALSRTGRFKQAIAAQEKVLTLLPADDSRRRESAQKRLAYLKKKLDG